LINVIRSHSYLRGDYAHIRRNRLAYLWMIQYTSMRKRIISMYNCRFTSNHNKLKY